MTVDDKVLARVSVASNGRKLAIEPDGLVLAAKPSMSVSLIIRRGDVERVSVIKVDAQKRLGAVPDGEDDMGCYLFHNIALPAQYADNHVRIIRRSHQGLMEFYEVALVCQGQRVFLTQQCAHNVQCYRQDGYEVVIPRLSKPYTETPWPEMCDYLRMMLRTRLDIGKLPYIGEYQPPVNEVKPLPPTHYADVTWYNLAHKLGKAITCTGDEAFILGQDVPQNGTRLRFLTAGQRVHFEHMVPQGERPYRLRGIQLVAA
jgi:hypothetical protein